MSTLPEKVKAVKRVYASLDNAIAQLQQDSGLHCLSGCGECCKKPDIEATPLEFLPLALQFYDEGRAEIAIEEIRQSKSTLCYVFRPHVTNFGGLCNEYPHRGLICRLFGFTARRNKEGQSELVTCKLIKEQQKELYEQVVTDIRSGKKVPVMSDYYTRISNIDPSLTQFYPINEAMVKALETVLHYYAYRKRRKPKS
ncbi:MAG: YkgJ family cysteine cluster protein [Flavobacteriales bacterium]|nr:YkgJ family cysteine cluster protein [Flavobacteriales bacterium]